MNFINTVSLYRRVLFEKFHCSLPGTLLIIERITCSAAAEKGCRKIAAEAQFGSSLKFEGRSMPIIPRYSQKLPIILLFSMKPIIPIEYAIIVSGLTKTLVWSKPPIMTDHFIVPHYFRYISVTLYATTIIGLSHK